MNCGLTVMTRRMTHGIEGSETPPDLQETAAIDNSQVF